MIDVREPTSVGLSVYISESGEIPKWIRPQEKGYEVVAKLPQD